MIVIEMNAGATARRHLLQSHDRRWAAADFAGNRASVWI